MLNTSIGAYIKHKPEPRNTRIAIPETVDIFTAGHTLESTCRRRQREIKIFYRSKMYDGVIEEKRARIIYGAL